MNNNISCIIPLFVTLKKPPTYAGQVQKENASTLYLKKPEAGLASRNLVIKYVISELPLASFS